MDYIIHLLTLISIYAILGVSVNLVVGYTGLLSVTHAAFFGLGAYVSAIFITKVGLNFFLALILGVILTAIVSFIIGLVLSKFKEDYYALGSLGFNVIVFTVLMNLQSITRGPLGIPGIEKPSIFGFDLGGGFAFLILSLVFLALIYLLSQFIVNSSFGRILKAIREDEEALQVFGYRTHFFKLTVFIIGAAMAAVAGSLFASYISFIDPTTFTFVESIFLLAIVILGGLANNRGAVLGAIILILLPEFLHFVGFPDTVAAQMRQVIYGLVLVLLMLYRPQGLIGEYKL